MAESAPVAEMIGTFVPMYVVTLVFAFGAFYLAPKIGANRWLWLLLCLIPVFNFFTICAFLFRAWGGMLDRLNAVNERTRGAVPFN